MMDNLIYRQAALDMVNHLTEIYVNNLPPMLNKADVDNNLRLLPSADVQSVVRCKDCRHRYLDKKYGFRCDLDTGDPFEEGRSAENDDWFCADGIKMNGEQMRRR